ncbi:caffeoyl-CoA O-methyltransferase-like protein, partial [Tanacetum coccineum]
MKELREVTAKHPWNLMTTSADEGQFLNLLLKLINAKNTMEIGVYTGYSLLSTALALPEDGKILALDINRENYEIGLPIIEKAGVAHKIDFREGPALPLLDQMVDDVNFHGSFDFIFVDADKDNYLNYHKRLIDLVKVGGVIGYDNTLWNGSLVAPADAPLRKYVRYYRDFVLELNKALAADSRVEICQLPVGDGITLCRRLSSFDFAVDITDDDEVQFFVGCACNSNDEFAHLFVSEQKNNQKNMFFNFFESTTLENEGPSNQDEPHFSNPESSFDFRSNEYNTDDVVNENPQNKIHKWQKFMSFELDIPETPVYKAKPNISKQYSQQSKVEKGKIFDNKESLILAVRLKALSE